MRNIQFQPILRFLILPFIILHSNSYLFNSATQPIPPKMSINSNINLPIEDYCLEADQGDRVLRSASKRKDFQQIDHKSVSRTIAIDGEQNFPNSVEKQRYLSVEHHSPFNAIFSNLYQKSIHQQETHNNASSRLENSLSFEKGQQANIIRPTKCAQIVFDQSFEDRNSVQTMDSKHFSSSFELDDGSVDKSSDGMKVNRMTLTATKNKDYFDHYVIQDDEENEQEKKTQANGQDNSSQRSCQKISLERDNSETHYDQSANNSEQRQKSLSGLDIEELKMIEKKKFLQKDEIRAAYNQTSDQNQMIAEKVKELQKQLKKTLIENQNYRQYEQMMAGFRVKLNTRKFDQSLKHLRKFSL